MTRPGTPIVRLLAALAALAPAAAHADETPPLSVYGFARLDLIVDDSRMSDAEQPFTVLSEPDGAGGDGELAMHPRMSRVGLSIDEWRLDGGIYGQGLIEVDFQNGGADASALMRLRHAYVDISLAHKFDILAGQTWDLMSPLFPSANNDSLMWNAGNTGDRRPQFRITATPIDVLRMGVAFSASGAVDRQDADGDGRMDGAESATPMVQWLIEQRMRMNGDILRTGFWGHFGREQLGDGTELPSWSIGMHLLVPVTRKLTLLGEVFHGLNLDDVRGGIGQGVNPTTMKGIRATGGWIEGAYVFDRHHMLAVGDTIDAPMKADVADGAADRNITGYGVYRYRPHESLQFGLEYIRWFTGYKNAPTGDANRFDVHMTVFF